MNCFPELTYSIYVDGELPPQEGRLVEAHLFLCPRCRQTVEALRGESRMLAVAIKEAGEAPAAEGVRLGRSLLWTALSAASLVAILDGVGSWLGNLVPSLAGWLSPLNRTTLMNLLFSGSLYVADQGTTLLQSIVATLTAVLLMVGVGGALYFLLRRNSASSLALLAGFSLMVGSASPASAIEHRKGNSVTIPSGETVQGTLIASGRNVTIDGTVNGDLIALGGSVVIRGTVNGDVIDAGHALNIEGNVTGNVYAFAQTLSVRGTIGHNLYGWIQTIEVDDNGRVQGDLTAGSAAVSLNGEVDRDVLLYSGAVQLRGKLGRNFEGYVGDVTLAPTAKVNGDLIVHTHHADNVHLEQGATVAGHTRIELQKPGPSRYTSHHFYFWQAVLLVGAFLVGLLLNWLFPQAFAARLDTAMAALSAFGVGFLVLIATPIAAIIAGFTLIGLPLAVISILAWLVALYLAKIFVAALIGQGLAERGRTVEQRRPFALALLVGLLIVTVAMELPFLGGWIKLLVLLLGLGLLFNRLRWAWKRRDLPAAVAAA